MLIKCTQCGKAVTAPGDAASAQGTCPHCQATVDLARAERLGLTPGDVVGDFRIDAVIGVGTHEGLYYLAMEHVDGESLRARLTRQGRLPLQEAVRLIDQVAAGLAYAHEQGVLHRDIKPGNILLMAEGTPKIVDFGIARMVGRDSAVAKRLTLTSG